MGNNCCMPIGDSDFFIMESIKPEEFNFRSYSFEQIQSLLEANKEIEPSSKESMSLGVNTKLLKQSKGFIYSDWEKIVKEDIIANIEPNSQNTYKLQTQRSLLLAIFKFCNYRHHNHKALLTLYLFSMLNHEGKDEIAVIHEFYKVCSKVRSIEGCKNPVDMHLSFNNFTIILIFYLTCNLFGISKIFEEIIGTQSQSLDFKRKQKDYYNGFNIKKFYYYYIDEFYENLMERARKDEVLSLNDYEMQVEDFERIFKGNDFFFKIDALRAKFIEFRIVESKE